MKKFFHLSREQFVKICTDGILSTRSKLVIANQVDGYSKYHKALKEDNYLRQVRDYIKNADSKDPLFRHSVIEHAGLGNCHELARHLMVEISKKIDETGAKAKISVVKSKEYDHGYLMIEIKLKGEKSVSRWEVDAWDPRIIDTSLRPDGSTKNHSFLKYGHRNMVLESSYAHKINFAKKMPPISLPKPKEGKPSREATPEREILHKHKKIYDNFTLKTAIASRKIDPSGKLHYLQRASFWQKTMKSIKNQVLKNGKKTFSQTRSMAESRPSYS